MAGFALHGGVHFGGLSELYGLARYTTSPPSSLSLSPSHPLTRSTLVSDNILGLTAVVANGHVVRLTASTCTIDGVTMPYGEVPRSTSPG